jgi:hypothetical protein
MAKSDYLEVNLLNHVLRATSFTAPGAVYLAAFTVAPTDAGGGTEVSGGAYARQTITFAAPSGNQVANSTDILFPIATASWGTVVHFGIFDAPSGGNLLYHTALAASRTIASSDQLRVPTGQLIVSED